MRSICLGRRVRAKEPLAIEVNQVRGCVGDPHFCFPCDLAEVAAHDGSIRKRGDVDQACG